MSDDFRGAYCHFRLSVVVVIARSPFLRAGCGRKPQIYRWSYYPIGHSSRSVSISGLGGHIAIAGCLSMSPLLSPYSFGCELRLWALDNDLFLLLVLSVLSKI